MATPEEWRPGSFTKNFSWGPKKDGLKRLHEIIRLGFANAMEDVRRSDFRNRVRRAGRPDYIPINFFLFNKIADGQDYIVADELVFQALNFDHSDEFDALALFAFNYSFVGKWKGAEEYQNRPALWAHHYITDRVASTLNWGLSRVNADDIEQFVKSDPRYHAKTARKLATNLNYLYQIGQLSKFRSDRVERWWVNALFLALDRLIEDRVSRGQNSSSKNWSAYLDRSNFHFISGKRSVEKDLATRHLLDLYEACGARERFSEEEVRERQKLLLPDIQWFANQQEPIAAIHPSNPRIIKTIPRACAMLAKHIAGFIDLDLDQLESLNLKEFIRTKTKQALDNLKERGISPKMSVEDLMKLTRGR
ncbi:MAG TPA: hypothetical protein VHW95_03885 [Steroidobacteraceae bacterium]|nr:hypothetical protein [Steroidobacteraceae bacterium]